VPLTKKAELVYPARLLAIQLENQLLDLGFLEHNVLANNGIKLFDLHFLRHGALVLGSGIEIASTGA
jgi:hypothetical protein|tara:strand:- start:268 stop:468 length:201 start_codon:yes stop_codon:yes gene_type:complete